MNAPDLARAAADAAGGIITFVIQFAPGTLDRQATMATVLLDTDQSATTGIRQLGDFGADYAINLIASTGQAAITKADPVACDALRSCYNPIGSAGITFVLDGMQVSVPLSLLGNDDGRMSFTVLASIFVQIAPPPSPLTAITFDVMPEALAPPGRVQ